MPKHRAASTLLGFSLALLPIAGGCAKKEPADRPSGLPPASGTPAPPSGTPAPSSATPAPAPAPAPPAAAPAASDEAETVPSAPDAKASISGTLVLPAARKKDVKPGDTIYLVVRQAGGPPGKGPMMAVQRLTAGTFPMPFTLSGRDAMIPGTPFEGAVSIAARVDKDGDAATRRKGDVFGLVDQVAVGRQDVVLPIDTLQTEDQTLNVGGPGGAPPGAGHGGLPPGHP